MHIRDERHVYESKVFMTDAELELSHCLYKGRGLDVADRSAELTTQLSKRYANGKRWGSPQQCKGPAPRQFHLPESWIPFLSSLE